jgi:hypothetical protein
MRADIGGECGASARRACGRVDHAPRRRASPVLAQLSQLGPLFWNNFTKGKLERRLKQIEESVARYMGQLDTADRQTAAGEDPAQRKACET